MLTLGKIIAIGYLAFGRTFAYFGFAPFFPAETYLCLNFIAKPLYWLRNLPHFIGGANIFWFLLFLGWGLFEVARGLAANRDLLNTLRGFAAHYYPLLFLVGTVMAPRTTVQEFAGFIRTASLCVSISGLAYAFFLSHIQWVLPWATKVPLFGTPSMPAFTCLGLLALLPYQGFSAYWLGSLNILALLANPGRASWLSFVVGTLVILLSERRLNLLLRAVGALLVLEIFSFYVGSWFPAAEGRGGTLSLTWLIGRVVATFDPGMAYNLITSIGGDFKDASLVFSIRGSTTWRTEFWSRVLYSLGTTEDRLLGHGYGFPLGALAGFGTDLFTPHNFVIFLTGYTGIVGALIFFGLLFSLLKTFLRLSPSSLKTFLISQLAATLILALFGNALETPFVAAPFYWIMGLAYGLAKDQDRETESRIKG